MKMHVSLDGYVSRLLFALALAPAGAIGCNAPGTPCDEATAYLANGEPTGFEQCDGPWLHRPEVLECASTLPRPTACGTGSPDDQCQTDADCTESPNGYCAGGIDFGGCFCNYGCVKDSDCAAGQICLCDAVVGYCVTADCTSDADCGGNRLCSSYVTDPGCGGVAFSCQTGADECASDADCESGSQCSMSDGHKACVPMNCVIGRPFLVDGEARLPEVERRRDWCADGPLPAVSALPEDVRAALAEEWVRTGQMEHAAVAAFARFALQLLSLGAPPELVVLTHQAMADETEHTRAAFSLASAYAGAPIGPGRLAMEGALGAIDAAEIVRLAILEGCIGETVAALEAAEAAATARDPAVRAVLAKITEDEARHAELAWRFVRWAAEGDASLAQVARETFEGAIAAERSRPVEPVTAADEAWLAHGVARGSVKLALRRKVVAEVLSPAAAALLAAVTAPVPSPALRAGALSAPFVS